MPLLIGALLIQGCAGLVGDARAQLQEEEWSYDDTVQENAFDAQADEVEDHAGGRAVPGRRPVSDDAEGTDPSTSGPSIQPEPQPTVPAQRPQEPVAMDAGGTSGSNEFPPPPSNCQVAGCPAEYCEGASCESPVQVLVMAEIVEPSTREIHPFFRLQNLTSEAIPLDNIVIRYYYTNETGVPETATCFWVTNDACSELTIAFRHYPDFGAPRSRVAEFTFDPDAGMLAGHSEVDIYSSIESGATAEFYQLDDHSFQPLASFIINPKVSVSIGPERVWGQLPD